MPRTKTAPEIRLLEAYIALDTQQRANFAQLLRGYEYNHKTQPAPPQRATRRKAMAGVTPSADSGFPTYPKFSVTAKERET